jgi:hypothetical protein
MVLGAAADAAVWELEEAAEWSAGLINDERLFDTHFALCELILDDGVAGLVGVG